MTIEFSDPNSLKQWEYLRKLSETHNLILNERRDNGLSNLGNSEINFNCILAKSNSIQSNLEYTNGDVENINQASDNPENNDNQEGNNNSENADESSDNSDEYDKDDLEAGFEDDGSEETEKGTRRAEFRKKMKERKARREENREKKRIKKTEEEETLEAEGKFWRKAAPSQRLKRREFKNEEGKKSLRERIFGQGEVQTKRRKKARIEFEMYTLVFFIYLWFGNIIPYFLVFIYFRYALMPIFWDMNSLLTLDPNTTHTWTIYFRIDELFANSTDWFTTHPGDFWIFITSPLVLTAIYLFRQLTCAYVGKAIYKLLNFIRPRKELYRANFMGPEADDVNIYHTRSFLLRILKWQFQKSPFPWMTVWMYNTVGSNKLGKGTVIEEGLFTLEFLETGKNVYMAPMAGTTTHFVEGSYQSLTIKGIKCKDNSVVGARDCISPGVVMGEDSQMLTFSGVTKLIEVPPGTDNFGMPASRLTQKQYHEFMGFDEETKKKDIEIQKIRRKKLKEMRRAKRSRRDSSPKSGTETD